MAGQDAPLGNHARGLYPPKTITIYWGLNLIVCVIQGVIKTLKLPNIGESLFPILQKQGPSHGEVKPPAKAHRDGY